MQTWSLCDAGLVTSNTVVRGVVLPLACMGYRAAAGAIVRTLQPLRYRLDVHTAVAVVQALSSGNDVEVWEQALQDAQPALARSPAHAAWLAIIARSWGMCSTIVAIATEECVRVCSLLNG